MNDDIARLKDCDQDTIHRLFIAAALRADVEKMHLLLTSRILNYRADIQAYKGRALCHAALSGKVEAVDFLLTSPLLERHAEMTDDAFIYGVKSGSLEVVKYMLTSPKLKKHPDLACQDNYALYLVCNEKKQHLIDYFLKELRLEVSQEWINYSKGFLPDFDWDNLYSIIRAQKLSHSLEAGLEQKYHTPKKIKI